MIILHGENQVESRKQLSNIKSGKQVVDLGSDVTLDRLIQAVESNSLFGGGSTVIVENIFSGRPSSDRKSTIEYLAAHQDADVVIWESKDIAVKVRDFDSKQVRRFDLPKYVFKFLDDLSLTSLHLALTSASAEQILALLAGHIGRLIMAKDSSTSSGFPAWQLAKLKSQAVKFTIDQLSTLNYQLLQIDYAQKTSSVPYDLATALEIFVVNLN